jgi:hypothetical protein
VSQIATLDHSVLRLLGTTPDVPQVGWIQKSAAMCRFPFCVVQTSLAKNSPITLTDDYEARWDRLVKPMATASLDLDMTLQEFESLLVVRGYVCPLSSCGTAGMTEEVCGVCVKPSYTPKPPPKNSEQIAARHLFDVKHPNLTAEERQRLFHMEFPAFLPDSASVRPFASTRTAALRYIFANQDKIALPFSVA